MINGGEYLFMNLHKNIDITCLPKIADRDKSNVIFMQSFRRVQYPEESLIKESIL